MMFIIMRSSVFAGTGSGFWWRKGTAGKGGGRMGGGHVGLARLRFLVDQVSFRGNEDGTEIMERRGCV
jgi:hypothetical protein